VVFWDDLGFATNYTVDADPEYPGDGEWGLPVVEIGPARALPTPSPVAVIRPTDGESWVLSTAFAGLGGVYGTPRADVLCLVEQFHRVVLINVTRPVEQTEIDAHPVRIAASVDEGLLLVAGWAAITAVGPEGIRWRSADLVLDDLHITRSDGGRIYYRGESFDGSGELRGSVDAHTGEVILPNRP
jgi:hypothetical protein